jgi:hypothetical protein
MMAFLIRSQPMVGGVPTGGVLCIAYAASRLPIDGSGNPIPPGLGTPVPDTNPRDAGPVAPAAAFRGTGGYYFAYPSIPAGGAIVLNSWIEADF